MATERTPPRAAASARMHCDRAPEHARVPAGRGAGPGVVAPGLGRQFAADGVRLEVGHPVDRDRAVPVRQHHRLGQRPGPGAQVHPGRVDQGAAEAEPPRRIVVAADHDDARAGVPQPDQPVLAQRHGVHRRDRAVVDVAGDQHGVDLLGPDDADEMIEVGGLGLAEVSPVQRAAEVPIGRVQHPHGRDTSQRRDTRRATRPARWVIRALSPDAGAAGAARK